MVYFKHTFFLQKNLIQKDFLVKINKIRFFRKKKNDKLDNYVRKMGV